MTRRLLILVIAALFASADRGRAAESAPHSALDAAQIEQLTGAKGQLDAAAEVFKVSVARSDLDIHTAGARMTPPLGLTSWAAFTRAGEHVAMLQSELQPVLRALRAREIQIVAIHNHMTDEEPRIIFLHYWGVGTGVKLAEAVRAALDLTRSATP